MIYQVIEEFVNKAQTDISIVNSGTLRFFGDWFGRPMDNCHVVNKIEYNQNQIIMHFEDNHVLTIENPNRIVKEEHSLIIERATKVRYEYGFYGPWNEKRKYYLEYINENEAIIKHSGLLEGGLERKAKIKKGHYALEICGR